MYISNVFCSYESQVFLYKLYSKIYCDICDICYLCCFYFYHIFNYTITSMAIAIYENV